MKTSDKITRVEVIDHTASKLGRVFVERNIPKVELDFQDNGATLKVFMMEIDNEDEN